MQAFADAGESGLALRQYDLCKARLARELAVDPAPETSALRAEIAGRALATVSGRGQGDVLPSIALLPFANRSGDSETGVLCDAFTDAIVSGLARFRDLRVTAAESSFAYKGRPVPIPEAARELGVHFVLEGSVLHMGGRVRVSATLADGGNGAALWARQFDRPDGDLSDVLDAITEQIVGQLAAGYGGSLGREWRRLSFHSGERNLRAYDHFQRGMAAYSTFQRGCTDEARAEFRAALEQRPGYGKALAKISWSHATDITAGWSRDVSRDLELSHQYAIEAIATEDGDSWGYWALAGWHWARREFDLCVSTCRTALSLNPNDADIRLDYGFFLNISGRHEEGLAEAAHAMELNPRFPEWWLMERAQMNFQARRYDDCLADLSALKILQNEFVEIYRAATNAALGNSAKSRDAVRRLLAMSPDLTVASIAADFCAYYAPGEDGDHLVHWLRAAGLPE